MSQTRNDRRGTDKMLSQIVNGSLPIVDWNDRNDIRMVFDWISMTTGASTVPIGLIQEFWIFGQDDNMGHGSFDGSENGVSSDIR
jgi:hypothetical protein